jgi:DNA modification methylase
MNAHEPTSRAQSASTSHASPGKASTVMAPAGAPCDIPIAPALRSLARPIAELREDPRNARSHPERNLEAIKDSLSRFGQQKPIVIARDGVVVAGNGTLAAARALGWTHLACVTTDLQGDAQRGFALADNRTAELAEWDIVRLNEALAALPTDLAALTGFDEREMARIARDADAAIRAMVQAAAGEDEVPPLPAEPVTRPGDLWILGEHRLLCGDSTEANEVARLMNGEKAALLATDPPYLVDYTGGNHPQSFSNRPEVRDKAWDAYKDPETGIAFFEGYLRVALARCREGVPVYQWHAHRRQDLVDEAWKRVGLLRHQQIIWKKAHAVLTRSHFMWQHEPCLYGWVEGTPPALRPPPNETTIWEIDQKDDALIDHPTVKPVEIFARPIRFHTVPGDVCLEPFSGSGTQIIAAEQLGRRCFAMEKAPEYVDVAVARWEKLTGKKAERVAS